MVIEQLHALLNLLRNRANWPSSARQCPQSCPHNPLLTHDLWLGKLLWLLIGAL